MADKKVFRNAEGILSIDSFEKDKTINSEYNFNSLDQLSEKIPERRPEKK